MVPGVQDPHDPDRLDHLLGAHGYLAAAVQHGGEAPAELEVPVPFGPNWPGLAVAAELSTGVDARPEGPLPSSGYVTTGELRREQALVFGAVAPRTQIPVRFPLNHALLEHARRAADRHGRPLGWRGGDRLTLTADARVMIARRDPGGMVTVPSRPHIVIPAALRCRYGLRAGDHVPLAAVPGEDVLAAYSFGLAGESSFTSSGTIRTREKPPAAPHPARTFLGSTSACQYSSRRRRELGRSRSPLSAKSLS
jgi:hypothetical protein